MTENDKHAVSRLLDALDRLHDARLSSLQLRIILLETTIDSAELSVAVNEAARALRGVLRLDARIEPPYDGPYQAAREKVVTLRSLLADMYDEFWASAQR